jgi:hypothetical protein
MATMSSSRPGRKPRPANQGERASLGLKVTPKIKNKLDAAAKLNGRTQSQEAEARIEQTFRNENYLDQALDLAYGRRPAALLAVIARVMDDAGKFAGFDATRTAEGAADWLQNPDAVEQVKQALCEILSAFQPEGYKTPNLQIELPPGVGPSGGLPSPGVGFARGILEAIKNPDRGGSIGEWAKPIREKLGDLATQLRVDDSAVIVSAIKPGPIASTALLTRRK